eukprot:COSAG01_NODE_57090_length_314_cov_1.186047_1_plen_32_part_10
MVAPAGMPGLLSIFARELDGPSALALDPTPFF